MRTGPATAGVRTDDAVPLPPTMRAALRQRYGPADVVEVREVAVPSPGPGEVLVEVHAAGLDRGVWHLMTGTPYLLRLAGFGLRRPRQPVLGMDVAGRVAAVGRDVTRFAVGDEVFGIGTGTFAEYALARQGKLGAKPAGLPFVRAAAVAISGLTAHVRVGQRVLVLGASGGVGSFAVQLARAAGARVTGVCSADKADLVRSLGAHQVIDYAGADATDGTVRYDLILDIGGRTRLAKLRRALTATGTLVIVGGENGGRWTGGIGRQLRALALSPLLKQRLTTLISAETAEGIQRLCTAIEDGHLTPAVEKTYPLDDVPTALCDLEAGRTRGKSVIQVRPTP